MRSPIETKPSKPTPQGAASLAASTLGKVLVITGNLNMYSVRKGVVELTRTFPQTKWMVLEHAPPRRLRTLLRNQWRNFRKNGWRWIPYEANDLVEQAFAWWHHRKSHGGSGPGARYSADAIRSHPNVSYLRTPDIHEESVLARVRAFAPDLGVSLAAPILRDRLFGIPRLGSINLHKGKLPDYRGMPPAFWEFVNNEPEVGCTIHRIDSSLDTGPILVERTVPRSSFSTVRGMQLTLDEVGVQLTCEALRLVQRDPIAWRTQSAGGARRSKPSLRQVAAVRRREAGTAGSGLRNVLKSALFWSYVRIARPVPRLWLGWLNRQRIVVLLYHRVSDELRDSLTVGIEQFDAQMQWLARHHRVVSIADIAHGNVPRDDLRPVVAVTFDDGYLDNYEHAVPILLRHNVPAAFFVSTGMIGTGEAFPHDLRRLGKALPSMNWDQLRHMHDLGFVIGSHSVTHLDCGTTDIEMVRRELVESRDALRRNLGLDEVLFAYPFGGKANINPAALRVVKEVGYAACLSAYGGFIGGAIDPYNIERTGLGANYTMLAFRAALEGFY